MIKTNMFDKSASRNVTDTKGIFTVVEFERDLSVSPEMAQIAYFASEMNVRKRQLTANITNDCGAFVQAGEMQLMLGDIEMTANVKGAGDLLKKFVGSRVTGETTIKPYYTGNGTLVLEPTYKYILLEDVAEWKTGIVVEDGMFLAAEETVDMEITARSTASSLILGREGIWNTTFYGRGILALESPVPADEMIVVDLVEDTVKIDGNMAVAWSPDLRFTVEKTAGTLVGSWASGEGFVNVYSGTGRVLIAPVRRNRGIAVPEDRK